MPNRPVVPRHAPAALLLVCLGLIGTSLSWRAAAEFGAAPAALAEILIATAVGVFAVVALAYLRRLLRDPTALPADLRCRAGTPGGNEALMFTGTALWPFAPGIAGFVWGLAVLLQATVVLRVALDRRARPPRDAVLTLFLLVPFGGLLLGPLPAAGALLLWPLLAVYAVTGLAVLRHLARGDIAERERPAAWVLLAPPSVATVAAEMASPGGLLAPVLYCLASLTLAGLLWLLRWMVAAGFQPSWACFTFPSAAFVGASWAMAGRTGSATLETLAFGAGLAVTVVAVGVAAVTLHAWARRRMGPAPVRLPATTGRALG
ncbi:MAG: SLAC1 family transporter [Alkalilacustris sp.]